MWRMCLTKQQAMKVGTAAAVMEDVPLGVSLGTSFSRGHSLAARVRHTAMKKHHSSLSQGLLADREAARDRDRDGAASASSASTDSVDIDFLDVENLLESYFLLVDSTYQSLISIGESG